ncbi:Na(+)/H(+) antiporter subunit B [Indiicoccus explosivorum]|uniref:Na(+)/H(+) antiporter subunit B n=1 Tax=Indiicoccus explosivorum TaxID=1917864 RepID=UPI000B43EBE2|nr:Na(+)/H(+) antiporter subunit B [Indiicoccus explosivorum]
MRSNDVIIQTATKAVVFIILLFAIYIFFAGHYSPGGGFVGGLLAAGALVLLMLAFDIETVNRIIPVDYVQIAAAGLLISLGTAAASILFGVPFFTHAHTYVYLPLLGKTSFHSATLFDLGVFLVVVGVTMIIIQTIGEDE